MSVLASRFYGAAFVCLSLVIASPSASASSDEARKQYMAGSYSAALPLAKAAVERGDSSAMVLLGMMYFKGQGVPTSYETALNLWRDAARKGNAKAQNNIGMIFQNGTGVERNYAEAAKWYMLAAKQNYGLAYSNLGVLYRLGHGVNMDYKKSLELLQRAEQILTKDLVIDSGNEAAIRADLDFVRNEIALVKSWIGR
jgi:TPR repeat protein